MNFVIEHVSRAYSKQLCEYREQCGCMLDEVGKALEFLQEMKERHQQVSHKTGALHQACEQLVEEQVREHKLGFHAGFVARG